METKNRWIGKLAATAGLLSVMLVASGSAAAAPYNIIFKTRAGALACATGGFNFSKTVAGTFPAAGASAVFNAGCLTPALINGTYIPGGLNVVVQNITTTEPQGPNVVGLTGTLQYTTSAAGDCGAASADTAPKTYTLNFFYDGNPVAGNRRYTITCSGPGTPLAATSGLYHVVNTTNPVPEPETLGLALVGLSALALTLRKRRRS